MNRRDFQALTRIRLAEAGVLLENGYYDGAYYLAGYAVECALKACIARLTKQHDFPPDRDAIADMYTHDLTRLIKAAGLTNELESELKSDRSFQVKWVLANSGRKQNVTRESEEARPLISTPLSPTDAMEC